MDTLDRFRNVSENIAQRFKQLQRAVAAGDKGAEHCFETLVTKLQLALYEADRYVVSDPNGQWITTNTYADAKQLSGPQSTIEDILTKY